MCQIIHPPITEAASSRIDNSSATEAKRARLARARAAVIAQFGGEILAPIARLACPLEKRSSPSTHPTSSSAYPPDAR